MLDAKELVSDAIGTLTQVNVISWYRSQLISAITHNEIRATHIQIQQLANLSTDGYFKSVDGEGLSYSEFSQSNMHLLFMQGHINLIHIHTISLLITVLV